MKLKTFFIAFFLFSSTFYCFSQKKFSFELYGGPSQSFLTYKVIPSNDFIKPSNDLSWHIGSTFFWGLKNDWQLTAQLEFFKRELGTYGISKQIDSLQITGYSTEGIPLLAFGARKNWGNLFLQPSISLMKSPKILDQYESINSWNDIQIGVISKSNLGLGLRIEGGRKFYNRRGNYFLGGLRYQQGLILMDQMNAPVRYAERIEHVLSVNSRGTYLGLFVGYGIMGHNIKSYGSKAPKRLYNDSKMAKHKLSLENGWYGMLYGGIRRREDPLRNQFTYSNYSGMFQAVLGYNYNRFSLESGFGNFSYNANYQIDFDGEQALIMRWEHYNMPVIPLTFKYHIPINELKTTRIGATFSGYFALKDESKSWFTSTGTGSVKTNEKLYEFTAEESSFQETSHSRFLFNAGLFTEFSVFNSSFLTLKVSRNFNSPDFAKINAGYIINEVPVSVESPGNLNGWLLDVGYKLPLKLINRELRLSRK